MKRNKKKIIRSVTVSLSCDLFEDVLGKLREKGFEMVVVTSPGPELDILMKEGIHCVGVEMERHFSLIKDVVSLLKLIKVFLVEKPQIVHSMTPKAGLLCMIAGWLTRVPLRVHTFTGLVWPTAKGFSRKILMATDWITCACATHVIPEGQGVLNDLKNGGITKKPMKVLGYGNVKGVDMERFSPMRLTLEEKSDFFTFLFVGRVVEDKGITELVRAFQMLHEKYRDTRLVLVGRFEDDLDPISPEIRNCIEKDTSIICKGAKYGDELVREYMMADCFVMPSYREGFPNTVLEAGAMELPAIVTDINGSREIVEEGINGYIIPPKTITPLFEAMERMLTMKEKREQMRKDARNMIATRFDNNFVQDCLIDFYEEILM